MQSYYLYCEDLAGALVGPFGDYAAAETHREFCRRRGDMDPGIIVPDTDPRIPGWRKSPGVLLLTPAEDLGSEVKVPYCA